MAVIFTTVTTVVKILTGVCILNFFNQAIIRKCGSLGLANLYQTNNNVKKIVSLVIALALLPANKIVLALQVFILLLHLIYSY